MLLRDNCSNDSNKGVKVKMFKWMENQGINDKQQTRRSKYMWTRVIMSFTLNHYEMMEICAHIVLAVIFLYLFKILDPIHTHTQNDIFSWNSNCRNMNSHVNTGAPDKRYFTHLPVKYTNVNVNANERWNCPHCSHLISILFVFSCVCVVYLCVNESFLRLLFG